MAQRFNVLSCYACRTFQVDQVKKSMNKWTCKICNEKQSIKQVFFNGSGKECRMSVQQMNLQRGNMEQNIGQKIIEVNNETDFGDAYLNHLCPKETTMPVLSSIAKNESKWKIFAKDESEDLNDENEIDAHQLNVTTERASRKENSQKILENPHQQKRKISRYQPYKSNQNGSNHLIKPKECAWEQGVESQGGIKIQLTEKDANSSQSHKNNNSTMEIYPDDLAGEKRIDCFSSETKTITAQHKSPKGMSYASKWDFFLPTTTDLTRS